MPYVPRQLTGIEAVVKAVGVQGDRASGGL